MPKNHRSLSLREAHALAEYCIGGLVSQSFHRLLVEERLLNAPFLDSVLFEPEPRREAHRLRYRPEFVVAGVLYSAFPQIGDVRAGHDATGGVVELLTAPLASIWVAVALQEAFELLRDAARHLCSQLRFSDIVVQFTIP